MKNNLKSLLYFLFAVGFFFSVGCSKSSQLGLSLVEESQSEILTTDTSTLILTTLEAEPTIISNRSRMVCGNYSDFNTIGEWGEVSASIYMNFRLSSTGAVFPNTVFDSLVLSLAYDTLDGHYGEILATNPTTKVQSWEVARLIQDIEESEVYDSDIVFSTGDILKSSFLFNPDHKLNVNLGGVEYKPHVRIKLDDPAGIALGESLLHPQGADTVMYESNTSFKDWFKGVNIRPTLGANNNSIIRFISKHALTKLTLYYTDTSNGGANQYSFDFLTNEDAEVVSAFSHVHPSLLTDNTALDTFVYVQGLDGLHTKVEFPNVENLGNVIINKAELVFMVADTGTIEFPEPPVLMAKIKNTDGDLTIIDDASTSLNNTGSYLLFGGAIEEINNTKTYLYRMNIAQEMQSIVDGSSYESAIYLTTPSALDPERIKLVNHQGINKAKLYLTYTKIQ
ncbi:MAG: DUF4270 domain-containing protein [Saprospiraceae bacterium]|nr:DUF4270 domain-containing protein [Saprospiraceae bacterium]